MYLGAFLGPTIGGFLVDNFGFPNSTMYMLFLFMFSATMDCAEQVSKIGRCTKITNKIDENVRNYLSQIKSASNYDVSAL